MQASLVCSHCFRIFSDQDVLQCHISMKHFSYAPYHCEDCEALDQIISPTSEEVLKKVQQCLAESLRISSSKSSNQSIAPSTPQNPVKKVIEKLEGSQHYRKWVMPRVYAAVKKEVLSRLNDCNALSFTSDIGRGLRSPTMDVDVEVGCRTNTRIQTDSSSLKLIIRKRKSTNEVEKEPIAKKSGASSINNTLLTS
uniref:C2H2-type domain-containing protein n=1 Tax=Ditylenchus dipsaci TaxID=166011 RepID=A0A915CZY2_9BILA